MFPWLPGAEHILLEPNQYLGDVLGDYVKQARSGLVTSKLLLKKRFFRPSDSGSTNRTYLQLCYVQVCRGNAHLFLSGWDLASTRLLLSLVQVLVMV